PSSPSPSTPSLQRPLSAQHHHHLQNHPIQQQQQQYHHHHQHHNLAHLTANGPVQEEEDDESGAPMAYRKIWVQRPNGSSTLVTVLETDLVDDVRDAILSKYRNALGRNYDAPDILLKIMPRLNLRPKSRASDKPPP